MTTPSEQLTAEIEAIIADYAQDVWSKDNSEPTAILLALIEREKKSAVEGMKQRVAEAMLEYGDAIFGEFGKEKADLKPHFERILAELFPDKP